MREAGLYADRLSVNLEIPTVEGLKLLAPDKDQQDMIKPMGFLKNEIISRSREEWTVFNRLKFMRWDCSARYMKH